MQQEFPTKPLFIGLAGTLNAGKDSFAQALEADYGFMHVSTGDMIREMKRREFGPDSPQALLVRNDPFINRLRNENGPGFLIDAIYSDWEKSKSIYLSGFVASGIRAIGEAEAIHKIGGIIVFVDADPHVRYTRSQLRARDSNEKGRSYKDFIESERREIDVDPDDKSVQNLGAMRAMADLIITNNGHDIESFKLESIRSLKQFLNQ